MGGQVLAVNAAEGSVAWEIDVGNIVVAMYILQTDGLHRLPYTVVGKETLEKFVKVILSVIREVNKRIKFFNSLGCNWGHENVIIC